MKYSRILLKLSGEALGGLEGRGLDPKVLSRIALEIAQLCKAGLELGIVVGGGNIFRGLAGAAQGMDRSRGDQMGMLATIINSLALQQALEDQGLGVCLMSALEMPRVAELAEAHRAQAHLRAGRVVIFGGGTGNPYFTTDTAAALRAVEIQAEVLFKATKVDGIYSADPFKDPQAKRYRHLSHNECLRQDLKVMDAAAFSLCRDERLPILLFSMAQEGNILRILEGEELGTLVA